jgi:predicted ribosome quality control (RQC) complex YloA/Tae2 family protein
LPLVGLPKFTREEKDIHRVHRAVEVKKAARVQLRQPAVEVKKAARVQRRQPALEEKKAAREQRRRFRRSEDFLGVQGANPVTGMWDISDYTSTTEQMSAETQKRVDDQVKELAEAQRRYEEAQKSHQEMLQRIQALRDEKQEEKEQKKLAEKIKRRRGERWRLTENGWSTDLSPIVQSPCTPTAGEYI